MPIRLYNGILKKVTQLVIAELQWAYLRVNVNSTICLIEIATVNIIVYVNVQYIILFVV